MKVSNFRKSGYNRNSVSIAAKSPDWFNGQQYKLLAPSWSIFSEYKRTKNPLIYTNRFNEEVLYKLDPKQVYKDLGEDSILLCYEDNNQFCHRFLVKDWLEKSLNITIGVL